MMRSKKEIRQRYSEAVSELQEAQSRFFAMTEKGGYKEESILALLIKQKEVTTLEWVLNE